MSETSTDGINGSQLFGVIKDLTNKSLLRYSADNAKDQTRDGDDVLKQSLVNNRLEILGGADKDKLSDNNIGVNAQNGKIHVKLSKELNDLTSTNVSGVVTNANGIAMGDKKITGLADGTDAHDAVNKGQLDKLGNNTFKLGANNNTETDTQALNKEGGLKFDIQGNNGLTASATGSAVTIGLDTDTKAKIDNAADKDLSNITDAGKNKIKEQITWKAKGTSTEAEVSDADKANDTDGTTVGADGTLTLDAGKNLRLKHDTATNTFTYALNKTLTDITSIGGNGTTITFSDKGADLGGKKLTNLGDGTDAGDAVNKGQLDKLGNNTFKLGGNNNTETDAQALNKESGLKFNVQGDGGLVASAKGNTVTLTFDEETKAKLNGSNGKIGNNHISFEGNNGTTDQQNLDKADGMKFAIQGNNGLTTSATGSTVTVGLDTDTKAKIDNSADKDLSNITDAGKNKIKEQITWKAKGTSTEDEVSDADKANDTDGTTVGSDGTLTLNAGKNLRLKHDTTTNTFTYALNKTLTDITSIGGNGTTITFSDKGADLGGKKLTNLGDGTDAGDAVNKGQLDKLGNNTFKLGSNNNTETDAQALNKEGGLKFDIQGNNGLTASATGSAVTIGLDTDTKAKIDNAADKDLSNITDAGKNKIKEQITWKAKGTSTEAEVSDADKANDTEGTTVGADGTLTLNAGKNLRLKHDTATNTFTYALNKTLTDITSIGGNGTTITFSDKGADLGGKKLTDLGDGTDEVEANKKATNVEESLQVYRAVNAMWMKQGKNSEPPSSNQEQNPNASLANEATKEVNKAVDQMSLEEFSASKKDYRRQLLQAVFIGLMRDPDSIKEWADKRVISNYIAQHPDEFNELINGNSKESQDLRALVSQNARHFHTEGKDVKTFLKDFGEKVQNSANESNHINPEEKNRGEESKQDMLPKGSGGDNLAKMDNKALSRIEGEEDALVNAGPEIQKKSTISM